MPDIIRRMSKVILRQSKTVLKYRMALESIAQRNYPPNFAQPYSSVMDTYAIAMAALDKTQGE
jgi:hypothetical protein